MKNLNLISKKILDKKFAVELSGYNCNEVDLFLDEIIEYIEAQKEAISVLEKKIIKQKTLLAQLNEKNINLKLDNSNLRLQLEKFKPEIDHFKK